MELYIIRHGQSTNNALPDEQLRVQDAPLTDLGKQQAQHLANWLADGGNRDPWVSPATGFSKYEPEATFGITHLYCSAMHRALQTAQPVSQALGLKTDIWIDIHEHGGIYQELPEGITGFPGRTRAEILEEFPDYTIPDGVTDTGWWDPKLGSEPIYTAYGRAIKVAAELRRRASEDVENKERIAIISHGTFIDALLKAFFNQLPNRQMFYLHYNTAITRLDFVDKERVLVRFHNRVAHLPREMVT